jgi:NodT family efflux transporter outer membrane factor (OMF) lipoprotein
MKQFFGWLIMVIGMAGCARVPPHDKAEMSNSLSLSVVVQKAADIFATGDWPSSAWWEEFDDPVLTDLIEQALRLSPTLQRAEARLKMAAQGALQKRAALFPEVDFDGTDNWQHLAKTGFFRAFAPTIPANVNDITLGLSFSYEFDFWGKNRSLFHAALGRADAMEAERRQAELILTTSIAYTYVELGFLLRKRDLLAQVEENTRQVEEIVRKRMEVGIDAQSPRLQSKVGTLDVQGQLVALEQQIEQNMHRLKALSGMGQGAEIDLQANSINPLVLQLPSNLELDLIARRPDLAAQKARVEALSHEIHAAKTDFYPNINLMGLVGFESVFAAKLFKLSNYSGTATPAIHLPIFTAGRLKAQLKEKVAQFNEAVYGYNELILQVAQEVADRLSDIALLQKQIELNQQSLEASEQKQGVAKRRLDHALDDERTLLQEKNMVLESAIALVDLEYGKQLEMILLIRALGGRLS